MHLTQLFWSTRGRISAPKRAVAVRIDVAGDWKKVKNKYNKLTIGLSSHRGSKPEIRHESNRLCHLLSAYL